MQCCSRAAPLRRKWHALVLRAIEDGRGTGADKKTRGESPNKTKEQGTRIEAQGSGPVQFLGECAGPKKFLLKDLVYKSFSFNLAKQISYKQKQTRYGRAINFGETKENNEQRHK